MGVRNRRIMGVATLIALAGTVFAGPGTGCTSFIAESSLITADFCFIFDCQNGLLGGAINPCSGFGSGDGTVESNTQSPLFTDCPNTN